MTGRLQDKVAFVTGASGSIGEAICQRFLAEGCRVVAADIRPTQSTENWQAAVADDRAIAIECDVGDSDAVLSAMARTRTAFDRLDILCNVAGGSTSADGPVTDAPEAEFWRAIRLDLFGTFLCCKYGMPEMIRSGGGSVINMTSMAALMPVPDRSCYTAAKGGVVALTRSMAAEYARHALRVNAIAPGITTTPRVEAFLKSDPGVQAMASRHLLGLGHPADVADMALYLASDEARIVTGQIIAVDGGVTIS
jgi:NAD(P)-dependent dehydrogenase (short-subunit alcohol dehydrogenase family)